MYEVSYVFNYRDIITKIKKISERILVTGFFLVSIKFLKFKGEAARNSCVINVCFLSLPFCRSYLAVFLSMYIAIFLSIYLSIYLPFSQLNHASELNPLFPVGSLNNGRLFNQATAMTRFYAKPMLLIEFDDKKPFSLQGKYYISNDLQSADIVARLQLLTLHFPKLR